LIRAFCLLLLTTFFICKATGVGSLLLAKDKIATVCNSDDCENEKTEVEKISDDQQINHHSLSLPRSPIAFILKVVFTYTVPSESEIFKDLYSPPPELV
jgi:regulatory protein YycH of two-component signal transduction system YycFG